MEEKRGRGRPKKEPRVMVAIYKATYDESLVIIEKLNRETPGIYGDITAVSYITEAVKEYNAKMMTNNLRLRRAK